MLNWKACIVAAFVAATALAVSPVPVMAQGCGQQNPNCIVPTAPPGTSNNQAASTAFVGNAIGSATVPYTHVTGVPANSFLGNNTGSPASAIAMSPAQATALLNQFSSSLQGLVPASGGGTSNFLRADGSFAVPPGTATSATTSTYATRATAIAATVPGATNTIILQGYTTANDNGGGTYTKLASPPTPKAWHFQSADGAWWQLVANPVVPKQVGAALDGSTDDSTAMQAWLDYGAAFGVTSYGQSGTAKIPTATLNLSANTVVDGGNALTIKRTTDTVLGLMECNSANNIIVRNTFFDTTAGFSSATSNTIGNGAHTFTVPAGLTGLVNGNFVQIAANSSAANRVNYMIAQITSYSGTSLVVNATTSVGSGTFAAWLIDVYPINGNLAESNIALRFQVCSDILASDNTISNRFYNALDSRNGSNVVFTRNRATGYVNRGLHMAAYNVGASALNNVARDNYLNGSSFSQYGINTSASDGGTVSGMVISGNQIINTNFQGIIFAGGVTYSSASNNSITMALSTTGVGLLVEDLVGTSGNQLPQAIAINHNTIFGGLVGLELVNVFYSPVTGNVVTGAGTGFLLSGSATQQTLYNTLNGNIANTCTSHGYSFTGSGANGVFGTVAVGNTAISNGGWGFISDANTGSGNYSANVAIGNTSGTYSFSGAGNVVNGTNL